MVCLSVEGLVVFRQGPVASNFWAGGVKVAPAVVRIVACMHPPSTKPAPNRTTNIPLIAILFLYFPVAMQRPQQNCLMSLLTEKALPLPWFPACPQSPSCVPVAGMPHFVPDSLTPKTTLVPRP